MTAPPTCTAERLCVFCQFNAGNFNMDNGADRERFHAEFAKWDTQRHRASRTLLRSYLSRSQRDTLSKDGYFIVTGSLGGKYRIYTWMTINNVFKYDPRSGVILAKYCMDMEMPYPETAPRWDLYLAQAIQLITDEKGFWTKSNKEISVRPGNVAFIDSYFGPYSTAKRQFPEYE